MLDILSITSPIYLVILIGFVMTRLGVFAKTDMRVLGKFVFNLALPALLFKALSQRQIGEILNPGYLLAYLLGSLIVIAMGYAWCRRISGLGKTESAVHVMGMTCSNSGYVGYPILLLIFSSVAGVSLALNMIVENLCIIPVLLFLAEGEHGNAGRWRVLVKALARLLTNPLIIGLVAGLAVSLTGWQMPAPLTRTVDMLASTCSALALVVVGGTLVGLSIHGMGRRVTPIIVGKLIVHPLAVFAAFLLLPLVGLEPIDPSLRIAAIVMAAMPMMGIYPTIAQAYGKEDLCAVALLLTTITSFFTLSALLWVLHGLA